MKRKLYIGAGGKIQADGMTPMPTKRWRMVMEISPSTAAALVSFAHATFKFEDAFPEAGYIIIPKGEFDSNYVAWLRNDRRFEYERYPMLAVYKQFECFYIIETVPWYKADLSRVKLGSKVMSWVEDFEYVCMTESNQPKRDILHIFNHFAQLFVDTEDCCGCEEHHRDRLFDAGDWRMQFHANHREYNRLIHEILVKYNLLEPLRRAVKKDLQVTSENMEAYGEVMLKTYAVRLLDFLKKRPSKKWF